MLQLIEGDDNVERVLIVKQAISQSPTKELRQMSELVTGENWASVFNEYMQKNEDARKQAYGNQPIRFNQHSMSTG